MKKLLSILLTAMLLSGVSTSQAFATETTEPGQATANAVLNAEAIRYSVSAPTTVMIYVDSYGNVYTPELEIINDSIAPVMVTKIEVIAKDGWTLKPATTDYDTYEVAGQKDYSLLINGQDPSYGPLTLNTPIYGHSSLPLALSAEVAPQIDAITATEIGEMIITMGWYEADTAPVVPPVEPPVVPPVVPEGYVLATDADFSGDDGSFKYIGTAESVVIPNVINGVPVTSYHDMFYGTAVKGVISTNPNITDMSRMFCLSTATTLDLSNLDTSSVMNMDGMFMYSAATTLDLSSFNTSNVTTMWSMFSNSAAVTIDLSSFNTSNVTNMTQMFSNTVATTLDLSSFDTSIVTDIGNMFMYSAATTGYAKTQADVDIFTATSEKPETLTFVVK